MSTKPHKTGNGALMRRFLPYLIKYKGVLFFDLFCAALTTLCDIALPTIMRTLTNTVSAAALTVDTVLRMAALYFVLRIINGAAPPRVLNTASQQRTLLKPRSLSIRCNAVSSKNCRTCWRWEAFIISCQR